MQETSSKDRWSLLRPSRARKQRYGRIQGFMLLIFGVIMGFGFGALVLLQGGKVIGAVFLFIVGLLCLLAVPWGFRGLRSHWHDGGL